MTTVYNSLPDFSSKNPLGPGDSLLKLLQYASLDIVLVLPEEIGDIWVDTFRDGRIKITPHINVKNLNFELPNLCGEVTIYEILKAIQNPHQTWLYAIEMITVHNRIDNQCWIEYRDNSEAYCQAMDCKEL